MKQGKTYQDPLIEEGNLMDWKIVFCIYLWFLEILNDLRLLHGHLHIPSKGVGGQLYQAPKCQGNCLTIFIPSFTLVFSTRSRIWFKLPLGAYGLGAKCDN